MIVSKVTVVVAIVVTSISVTSLKGENKEELVEEVHKNNVVYNFMYKTDDGVERNEEGVEKEGPDGKFLTVAGSYKYEVDGIITFVTYIADADGFKPIVQIKRRNNAVPIHFTLDNRIDPKLLGTLAGGGLG